MKKIKKVSLIFLLVALFGSISCNKDNPAQSIPTVYVNITLDLNSTLYVELNTVGGWLYLTGGYKGIVVYRLTQNDFVAYDRACSFDPTNSCRLEMDNSALILIDSCCGSEFIILDGSVHKPPATAPLRQYYTSFDGQYLHIYN